MATVTFNGVRLNDADSNTGWGNFGSGGSAPGAEPQLRYQGSNAVNKKVTSTNSRAGVQFNGTGQNMVSSHSLWIAKMKVGDAGDLNTTYGCEVTLGSSSNARHSYNVSGSSAANDQYSAGYNSQGGLAEGYIITAINPNVSGWRAATTGSPNLSSVSFFAVAAQFVTGGAKSENVACDAIDVGTGLDYNGTSFTFNDGADTDQNIIANRWGFACRNGSVVVLRGLHRVAPSAATTGTDTTTVQFPDGYHGTGDAGIEINLGNALTDVTLAGTYSGLGRSYGAADTRPDFTVTGLLGSTALTGTFVNFRQITLTSAATCSGATFRSCDNITQNAATISNCIIADHGAVGITSAVLGSISNCRFISGGTGHAIEITTPGVYNFSGNTFEGYGANGTTDAAIYNNSGGAVTINIAGGGDTPTIRNGTGASSVVNSNVLVTLTGLKNPSEVRVFEAGTQTEIAGTGSENVITGSHFFSIPAGQAVDISILSLGYQNLRITNYSSNADASVPVSQVIDRQYANG